MNRKHFFKSLITGLLGKAVPKVGPESEPKAQRMHIMVSYQIKQDGKWSKSIAKGYYKDVV